MISTHPMHQLLDVARQAIRRCLAGQLVGDPPQTSDPQLLEPAGCFVSLHTLRSHRLRGCIGRLAAQQPLIQIVWETARGVLDDPRFATTPVTLDELPELELEISVLSPLVDAPTPLDFDPLTEGISLTCRGQTGCFLPQVARDTGWDRRQLLERLCTEKMDLPPDAWRSPEAKLRTFRVTILGPAAFGADS